MSQYTHLVFIGRFQPYHKGHLKVIETALKIAEKVIVLIGSANSARNPRNPFTFDERKKMIEHSFLQEIPGGTLDRLIIKPLNDFTYSDAKWIANVQAIVNSIASNSLNPKIGLIGHSKDNTSYYLKKFPMWHSVNVPQHQILNATDIRTSFFTDDLFDQYESDGPLPKCVHDQLIKFKYKFDAVNGKNILKDTYKNLTDWFNYDIDYKKLWENTPYPVMMTCVDALVIQSGHILLIKRKHHPGKGLLALPGGHVNIDEKFIDAAIRELKEETRISDDKGEIPPAMLESYIDDSKTTLFDDPHRSSRARVITQVYQFNLPERQKLFKVRGDDDAESAQWYNLGSLKGEMFFDDHYHIIIRSLGID